MHYDTLLNSRYLSAALPPAESTPGGRRFSGSRSGGSSGGGSSSSSSRSDNKARSDGAEEDRGGRMLANEICKCQSHSRVGDTITLIVDCRGRKVSIGHRLFHRPHLLGC